MASELDELYRDLEQKVAQKSRELVRSERLASVGYLAAGVAHEINNPIGIIAGYAELAMQKLDREASPATVAEARQSLGLICEEAFRCKEIVQKLLSLARPGEESRAGVAGGCGRERGVDHLGAEGLQGPATEIGDRADRRSCACWPARAR